MSGTIKILHVITRLNIGGTAQHVVSLAEHFNRGRYRSVVVVGQTDATEGDMGGLLQGANVRAIYVPSLRRRVNPLADALAWWRIFQIIRCERPAIVHTHTAKAGALGRTAALAYNTLAQLSAWFIRHPAGTCRLIHTFHGHVLEGYFSPLVSMVFRTIERFLGRRTDQIIALSAAIRQDLLRMGIGSPERMRVVQLGLELEPLLALAPPEERKCLRVGAVGRLVPIKNHQMFLEVARRSMSDTELSKVQFQIVGDGELRRALELAGQKLGLNGRVTFSGWESNMPRVYRDLDILCLTSLNEGTPASMIEALAAGRAVVAVDVGGIRDLMGKVQWSDEAFERAAHGLLVRPSNVEGFVAALRYLVSHRDERFAMGQAGRVFVRSQYGVQRLADDIESLYQELMR